MAKKRYVQVNELKPEMVEAYREAHETMHIGPWKEQLDVLKKAGAEECICLLYTSRRTVTDGLQILKEEKYEKLKNEVNKINSHNHKRSYGGRIYGLLKL